MKREHSFKILAAMALVLLIAMVVRAFKGSNK